MSRSYQLDRRAETQRETRRRIIEAAIELHQERGPAFTSVTDLAKRAGVGRVTVYRHFPSEALLLQACSGLYAIRHPLPPLPPTRPGNTPTDRLRAALTGVYAYHADTEPMMARVLPQVGDQPVMRPYHEHFAAMADSLTAAFRARGRRRTTLHAAITLALSFHTWRLLVRDQQLSNVQAINVVLRMVA